MYEQQLDTIQQQFDESQQRVQVLQTDLANREKVFRDLNDQAFRQANAIVETANQEAQLMVSQAVSTAKLLLAQLAKLMNETREVDANLQQQFDDLSQTIQNLQNQQLEISPNREDWDNISSPFDVESPWLVKMDEKVWSYPSRANLLNDSKKIRCIAVIDLRTNKGGTAFKRPFEGVFIWLKGSDWNGL